MKSRFAVLFAVCTCAYSQLKESQPGPPPAPDTVVAIINGRKLTAREYQRILASLDAQSRQTAETQPQTFLDQWAAYETIFAESEKAKLDQQTPYKERIADSRRQILIQGLIEQKGKEYVPTAEQLSSYFEANRDRYFQAKVKVIFISRASQTREIATGKILGTRSLEEGKAKADLAAKRARAGEDFVAVAKDLSDDKDIAEKGADFPEPIRPNSANVPPPIRDAILAGKAGNIIGPVEHETGYYIFRIESIGMPSLDQTQGEIQTELKNQALRRWLDDVRKRSKAEISSEAFFKAR